MPYLYTLHTISQQDLSYLQVAALTLSTHNKADKPIAEFNKIISLLRQCILENMLIRKPRPKPQQDYIRAVVNFTRHLKPSPDTATTEDLRDNQLPMTNLRVSNATINSLIAELTFIFDAILGYIDLVRKLQYIHKPRKFPEILSVEQCKDRRDYYYAVNFC